MITARSLAIVISLGALPASAQEFVRRMELPAHQALMAVQETSALRPFESDGCSGGLSSSWELVSDTFPDFERSFSGAPPWEECCVAHDRSYHGAEGATEENQSFEARLAADRALRACVIATGREQEEYLIQRFDTTPETVKQAYATIAGAMYLAVRFGGGPCSGLPWRWGFGYPACDPFGWSGPARD